MAYIGELVLIKEEEMQIKEEEIEANHEAIYYDEGGGPFNQGEKRSLSPSSFVGLQGPNKRRPHVDCVEQQNVTNQQCKAENTDSTQQSEMGQFSKLEGEGRGKHKLTCQSRKMVMKVRDFFRSRNQIISEMDLDIKVAAATGTSARTVQRVKKEFKEGWIDSPPPVELRWSPVVRNLDDFWEGCIRREILSFYERGEIPTLNTLYESLRDPPFKFQGHRSSLYKIIKRIGFHYRKMENRRRVLVERDDVVAARCKVLRILNNNRNISNPRSVVYVGETTAIKRESHAPNHKTEKMGPLTIMHAGGKKGLIPGALHIFKPKTGINCHNGVTPECFRTWFEDQLLPNIPNNSLIVLNSSSSHTKLGAKIPNRCMKKSDITDWLVENNIAHDSSISKAELLHLANSNKHKYPYEIDQIAQSKGHEVLRLPPYHNHLNPTELIFDNIKSELKRELANVTKVAQKKKLISDAISKITEEDWNTHMEVIVEIEEDYRNKEKSVDHVLETLCSSLDEATSDDED